MRGLRRLIGDRCCYAYRVDGQGFSETIVFEARVGQ